MRGHLPALRGELQENGLSFDDRLEQPDKLRFAEARVVKDCFDDRRFLPSRKQNLGPAKDRSPTTAGLREEPDCADDGWQLSLIRLSRPPANRRARQSPRPHRFDSVFNQKWLIGTRKGKLYGALRDGPRNLKSNERDPGILGDGRGRSDRPVRGTVIRERQQVSR